MQETLKIYGIYVVHKNGLEIENICPKQCDYALPHLSTFLPLLHNILRKDVGEKFTIELSSDILYCFIGEYINIIAHTERKNSEEFVLLCEKVLSEIAKIFPSLKKWNGEKIPGLKEYLNKVFFEEKFTTIIPINKTDISLEEEIIRNACENVDSVERAHQLFLMCNQVYDDKRFLNKCTYRMEKQHSDCYHVPRIYSLLGLVFNNLGEYEIAYEYFERAIDNGFKNKQESLSWLEEEELKIERNARIRNSAIALADAYYGLAEYNLVKNDFLKAKECLKSAKKELEFVDIISKNLREVDFELMYATILMQQRENIEKKLEEETKISISKIQNIERELENIFNNLQINIEDKIKTIDDDILKRFYKEKLVRLYSIWGDFFSSKENFFSKKWNEIAIEKYENTLQIMDEIGLIKNRGKILFALITSYAVVENFERSYYYLQYLKKESEYDKTIILEARIGDIFYNIFYYMKEKDTVKILESILEINSILEKETIEKIMKEKIYAINKKTREFLKEK